MSLAETRQVSSGWGLLELFVLIQSMSSALLFIPGAQAVRMPIRALPYVASLAMLFALTHTAKEAPKLLPASIWLLGALAVLPLGLFFPDANPIVGLAQLAFQLSIAAPLFWLTRFSCDEARVQRLLVLILLANGASAAMGVLQVYSPERFQPPEFSSLGQTMNSEMLNALSYVTDDGRRIIRPCGLTDLPGGAAGGAAISALLGFALAVRPGAPLLLRLTAAALGAVGILCLYLTHVRSLLLTSVVALGVLSYFLVRQGRPVEAGTLLGSVAALVVGMFTLAITMGGAGTGERFLSIFEGGLGQNIQSSRGIFVEHTLTSLLQEYPLGAGAGRCGMMYAYFSPYESTPNPGPWAEIQITFWLIDGGVPLIILYSGAIVAVLFAVYQVAMRRESSTRAYSAALVFCVGFFTVAQSFAGPTFNNAAGIQFWFLTGMVLQAAQTGDALHSQEP